MHRNLRKSRDNELKHTKKQNKCRIISKPNKQIKKKMIIKINIAGSKWSKRKEKQLEKKNYKFSSQQ